MRKVDEPNRHVGVLRGRRVALVDDQHRAAVELEVPLQLRSTKQDQSEVHLCILFGVQMVHCLPIAKLSCTHTCSA